jgi:16S rRNA (adenine1518-N6/adenine1519-N6)-dimethyltransferase
VSSLPVTPNRELGQHFLVDENILRVIGRLAALEPDDVVLEIGAGLGVLTQFLAERVTQVHAVEIDRSLEPYLEARFRQVPNVALQFGDALMLPLASLRPAPNKLVANLPYGIATPVCVESLDGLPSVELWCVMVQREIAERFVARPGTRSYGAASVLVQLTTERLGSHAVARSCFQPRPRVDSALIALRRRRRWGSEYPELKRLVQGAFSHRRKTLANSLELTGVATREQAARALRSLGRAEGSRAQELAPEEFVRLLDALSGS